MASIVSTTWTKKNSLKIAIRILSLPHIDEKELGSLSVADVEESVTHDLEFGGRDSSNFELFTGGKLE